MTSKDLINRQAAIDMINIRLSQRYKRLTSEYIEGMKDGYYRIRSDIERLPSAQPETHDKHTETHACDLISRQAAIDAIDNANDGLAKDDYTYGVQSGMEKAKYVIEELSSAETERKKGKWIKLDMHAHIADHKCTACGQECYVPTCMGEPMYAYCPNCGADMRG